MDLFMILKIFSYHKDQMCEFIFYISFNVFFFVFFRFVYINLLIFWNCLTKLEKSAEHQV